MTDYNEGDVVDQMFEHVQTGALYTPQMLEEWILTSGRSFLGVFTVLAELIARRGFGTQTIHPITYVAGWFVLQIATIVGVLLPGRGLVGMATIYTAFVMLSLIHAVRLAPKYRNMDLEDDGEAEGPVWPFFRYLPFASEFTVRCFYEPVGFIAAAALLGLLHILTPFASIYLMLVGFCLGVRALLRCYELWRYVRNMRNNQYRARMLNLMLAGKLSPEQVRGLVFVGMPANMPLKVREQAALTALKSGLEPAFAALKSEPDKRDAA